MCSFCELCILFSGGIDQFGIKGDGGGLQGLQPCTPQSVQPSSYFACCQIVSHQHMESYGRAARLLRLTMYSQSMNYL